MEVAQREAGKPAADEVLLVTSGDLRWRPTRSVGRHKETWKQS